MGTPAKQYPPAKWIPSCVATCGQRSRVSAQRPVQEWVSLRPAASGTIRARSWSNCAPSAVEPRDALDPGAADQLRPCGRRAIEQTAVIETGMDTGKIRNQGSTAIKIARDLVTHRFARQHRELAAKMLFSQRPLLLELVILPLRLCENEAAGNLEAAVDLLRAHACCNGIESSLHLAIGRSRV